MMVTTAEVVVSVKRVRCLQLSETTATVRTRATGTGWVGCPSGPGCRAVLPGTGRTCCRVRVPEVLNPAHHP